MKRLSVAFGLALGAAALLCAACGGGSAPAPATTPAPTVKVSGNKGGPRTYVYLTTDASGTCIVSPGVGTLGAKPNGKITWYLTNGCGTEQFVVATHYQEEKGGDPNNLGPVDPKVVDPDPAVYDLKKDDDDKKLDAKIISTKTGTLYKYWICTSGNPIPNPLPDPLPSSIHCLDPDADVWP